ncbi:hypothetical protein GGR52DRAFT_144876 [Hypoxylon sp. FL1284]|nr:hypothetical protein GGR52DRAFT_144876 [Hypoxylon sp. FL1284]
MSDRRLFGTRQSTRARRALEAPARDDVADREIKHEHEEEELAFDQDYHPSPSMSRHASPELNNEVMNNRDNGVRPSIEMPLQPRGNEDLLLPSDKAELRHIINALDKRHSHKFRWYVTRHLRRNHDQAQILSRQLYYKRLIKGHVFQRSNGRGGGQTGWVLKSLRSVPFSRLDYEATRAHLEVRETFNPTAWSSEKKRIPPERLTMILREAPKAYGWQEVITGAAVDKVLGESGVFDLAAYEISQGIPSSPLPPPPPPPPPPPAEAGEDAHAQTPHYGSSDSDYEDELGRSVRWTTEEAEAEVEEQAHLRQDVPNASTPIRFHLRPSERRDIGVQQQNLQEMEPHHGEGRVEEPQTPRDEEHSSVPANDQSEKLSCREAKARRKEVKKVKKEKQGEKTEKEKRRERKAHKRQRRQLRELEAQLEGLQQQFQEDLMDASVQYHRRRARIEKKMRLLQSP